MKKKLTYFNGKGPIKVVSVEIKYSNKHVMIVNLYSQQMSKSFKDGGVNFFVFRE